MKKYSGYDTAKPYEETQKLPTGGYIIKIWDAEEVHYDWGDQLLISFDIAEGEFKDFYGDQYRNSQLEDKKYKGVYRIYLPKEDGSQQDEWTTRRLKTEMTAIEDSNPGFHWDWDEKKLKEKKVGAVFFEKEYDFNGKRGFFTTLHSFRSVEKIKNGDYKLPDPKMLDKPGNSGAVASDSDDFAELGTDDGELPF